jgi:DNA-binding GntR family transcriptional regulator
VSSVEGEAFTRPPTAQEAVLVRLRQEIGTGRLAPGEQVRQDALAERLGVSRVPLREALKILEGEGQVVYHPHRGYFVAQLSVDDLVEVYRIRALLEAEAIRVGAPRNTDADRAAIERARLACEDASAADDLAALATANRSFHFAIYGTSGMPRLVRLIRLCWDATDVYRFVYYSDASHRRAVLLEHAAIAEAFVGGDVDRAIALLSEHREHAVSAVTATLSAPTAAAPQTPS